MEIDINKPHNSFFKKVFRNIDNTLKDFNKSLFNYADSNSVEFYNLFVTLSKENRMSFEFIIII